MRCIGTSPRSKMSYKSMLAISRWLALLPTEGPSLYLGIKKPELPFLRSSFLAINNEILSRTMIELFRELLLLRDIELCLDPPRLLLTFFTSVLRGLGGGAVVVSCSISSCVCFDMVDSDLGKASVITDVFFSSCF